MFSKVKKTWQKWVAVLLILTIGLPTLAGPVQAFTSGPNNTYPFQFMNAVFETDEMNLQSFVYETLRAVIWSIIAIIVGDPEQIPQYLMVRDQILEIIGEEGAGLPPELEIAKGETGLAFSMINFIALTYETKPVSGVNYLARIGRKLKIVPPAYAAGAGWNRLEFLLDIWTPFRNVAYAFFVLVIIYMGFAIMFKMKISPQAVVTIQTAIPRVIIALVLVTFSYAIVGLMVDIMYVIMNFIISLFKTIPLPVGSALETFIKDQLPSGATTETSDLFWTTILVGIGPVMLVLLATILLAILGTALWVTGAGMFLSVFSLILALLLFIILLVALFKVCWALLKAYINVILAVVFAPFILLAGALPGSDATKDWFKNLLANLAVWPVTLVMCFLAGYLAFAALMGSSVENLILLPIIGLGILLLTPKAADIIKSFMAGQSFNYGSGIGEATGAAKAPLGYSAGRVYQGLGPLPGQSSLKKRFPGAASTKKSRANLSGMAGGILRQGQQRGWWK